MRRLRLAFRNDVSRCSPRASSAPAASRHFMIAKVFVAIALLYLRTDKCIRDHGCQEGNGWCE